MSGPTPAVPQLMSPQRILAQAAAHTFALDDFDFKMPIDRSRLFLCPTLTPLYYTPIYSTLSEADQRRYNQLTALCFAEMIGFFEGAFVAALHALTKDGHLDQPMADCVAQFVDDEDKHQEMWRRLNRLTEPEWYVRSDRHIVRIPWLTRAALGWFARRPGRFPVVIWIMLALEEHSMEISRRCNRLPADAIEPRYRAVYRAHMEEEVRHIHTDFNLLQRLLDRSTPRQLRVTAWLFRRATETFLLKPKRAAVRVVERLLVERPTLRPLRRTMVRQLGELTRNAEYRRLMLSAETTPMAFSLMRHLSTRVGRDV